MHHRAAGPEQRDVLHVATRPPGLDDEILDLVARTPVVRGDVELAGHRIVLRVGAEAPGQRAVEVGRADRLEQLSSSSMGTLPASTMANVRPAWPITLVLAGERRAGRRRGRGAAPVRRASSSTSPARTQRFRYHSARPSRSRIPWTIPSPTNQWWVPGRSRRWGWGRCADSDRRAAPAGADHLQIEGGDLLRHRCEVVAEIEPCVGRWLISTCHRSDPLRPSPIVRLGRAAQFDASTSALIRSKVVRIPLRLVLPRAQPSNAQYSRSGSVGSSSNDSVTSVPSSVGDSR